MNTARRKPRKLLRTVFTVLTGLITAGYLLSGWYAASWIRTDFAISLDNGLVEMVWGNYRFDWGPTHAFSRRSISFRALSSNNRMLEWGDGYFSMALWPLTACLVMVNVIWYWGDWRRGYGPGFCQKCGYDLRATPDRCPECGVGSTQVRR